MPGPASKFRRPFRGPVRFRRFPRLFPPLPARAPGRADRPPALRRQLLCLDRPACSSQVVLVGGYAYALLCRSASAKGPAAPAPALLAAALVLMPTLFPARRSAARPDLLWRLAFFIAFPFLLLSASTTLCHKLLSDASGRSAFSVFAWSKAGSLAGMFSYSLLVEPALSLASAALLWRGLFAVYTLLFAAALLLGFHRSPARAEAEAAAEKPRYFLWAVLPAGSAALLAAVTSYQSSATASMPLTWMIPLTVYCSPTLCFFRAGITGQYLRLFFFSCCSSWPGFVAFRVPRRCLPPSLTGPCSSPA